MKKISKMLKGLIVGALIISASVNEAKAFFLTPPMPWDIELDIPANAIKMLTANPQTLYRQIQTHFSELNTNKLQAIKKARGLKLSDLKNILPNSETGGKVKTPMKKEIKGNGELEIEENDVNEEHYFNAYYKLFMTYPPEKELTISVGEKTVKIDYPVFQTAYKHKATQYRQDVIIDTYLTGRLTEDYLAAVDKTLQRLDLCLNRDWDDVGLTEEKCTFFGLHMVKVKNNKEAPTDPDGKNAGQLGAAMNAYVVTTVYDRLMRIVEDLTATEAIYRAAKQLDKADPIMPKKESNAEKYLNKTYQFAYSQSYDHNHAQSLLNPYNRLEECKNGGDNCPDKNEDKAELVNMDNTEVLRKLKPIDDMLDSAVQLHNLKNQMPEYKAQFRKYQKAKEVHARALKTVAESDKCVQDFLSRHGGGAAWGASSPVNDYASRSGISRELIETYQKAINETIIGTTRECEGFYATANSCPEGYVLDTKENCSYEDENGNLVVEQRLHPCVLETVAIDMEKYENIPAIPNDYEEAGSQQLQSMTTNNTSYDNADYLLESGMADKIDLENRKKAEQAWRIGSDKVMELTESGLLKFDPWNDQQNLQQEYLHNKYRNIRMIIKSVDQGVQSYKIAAGMARRSAYTGDEPINILIQTVTECASLEDARNMARERYCAGYPKTVTIKVTDDDGETTTENRTLTCSVTKNDNTGVITTKKDEKIDDYTIKTKTITEKQVVSKSKTCPYKGTRRRSLPETNQENKCAGKWDFSVSTLVKQYFPTVLGGCAQNPEEQEKRVYNKAHDLGRKVAMDYFNDVLEIQLEGEQELKEIIQNYNENLENDKKELQSAKDSMKMYNQQIDEATKEKNRLYQEVQRTEQRTSDIEKEYKDIEQRLNSELITEKDVCALKIRQLLLKNEEGCINKVNYEVNATCPQECSEKAEIREKQCQQLNTFKCETYIRDVLYVEKDEPKEAELTFVIPSLAKEKIAEQNPKIESAKAAQNEVKDKVKQLEDKIKANAEAFANRYLEMAKAKQGEIESKNKAFEDFLETADGTSQSNRMKDTTHKKCCAPSGYCFKKCDANFTTDNLQTTLEEITYHGADLETAIKYGTSANKESLNSVWFKDMDAASVISNLQKIGVPATFVTDGTVMGLANGPQKLTDIADAIIKGDVKEEVLNLAANTISNYIRQADKIIEEEVNAAVEEVNAMAESLGVLDTSKISAEQAAYLSNSESHKSIVAEHEALIKALKKPTAKNENALRKSGVNLTEIFGIPGSISTDDEYFVGLPARGNNYIGLDPEKDKNAGRDYNAPRKPLLNLPPVREVFYYSALDYDDTPKENGKPAIPYLLNFKYPDSDKIEYLPEIWRYLLARPNLRPDGKYQKTFFERSLSSNDYGKLLRAPNGGNSDNYRTIIGRGGIYPCEMSNGSYVDISGDGDDVSKITFKSRSSLPAGVGAVPSCQEIALNNVYGTNSCYVYNKGKKGGICHLMADHGKPDVEDSQPSLSKTTRGMYKNYSELGQFLNENLKYRPLHEKILTYQLDSKHDKNDIERRKAETATFKHNVMGSFLEAVNMEHGAKENLDNIENDIEKMLISLCEQLHEANWTITDDEKETAEVCAAHILDNGGLAENGEDTKYGETGEYGADYSNFEGINCPSDKTLYENIFCNLKALKEEALANAKNGYSYEDKDTGEKVKVAGFNEVKGEADSRIQERIDNIQKYIDMLETDNKEVVLLTPNLSKDTLKDKIPEEKTNRALARISEDEGIKAMDNQSQSVAYCPVY